MKRVAVSAITARRILAVWLTYLHIWTIICGTIINEQESLSWLSGYQGG